MAREYTRQPQTGDTGTALFISHGSTWWRVSSEDADPKTGYREGGYGAYAPFDAILAAEDKVFPSVACEDGTIVRVTVEVVRP